jgi:hypothetical protein
MTPRSSSPGGDATPLQGAANLRLSRKSTLYLKIWREALRLLAFLFPAEGGAVLKAASCFSLKTVP